jgi:hypothetical protein
LLGARICARLGLTRAATAGLSLVFDGEYAHSVERALANPDPRFRPVCDENLVKTRR